MCVLQVQQISKRMDTEVCNVRIPGRLKHNWEQNKHKWFVTWGKWATEGEKNYNSPAFGEGIDTMRYSATWLSVCWAATLCCPSWLVWICWAGSDGLLKHSHMEYLKLFSPHRYSQTLNCYSCCCNYQLSLLLFICISFSLSSDHIIVLLITFD